MRTLLTSALLLIIGVAGTFVPQAAVAGETARIQPPVAGYVWGNQPATASYHPDTGYELNSTGGTIQISHRATGWYYVRFEGMGREGGIAHAGAYGSNHRCVLPAYHPKGDDEVLVVRCFDVDGNPVDSRFVANFATRRPAGVAFGYLRNDNPVPGIFGYEPPAASSHDGAGQPIRVFRGGVGLYEVELGAFAQDVPGQWRNGFLAATVYGSYQVTCHPHGSLPAAPTRIRVTCADLNGQPADATFTLTYARDTNLLGGPARASATAWGIGAPVVEGGTNPAGGAPIVTRLATGYYQAAFPNAAAPRGHAFGTLLNTSPMFCNVQAWWSVGTTQDVRIRCYDPALGEPHPVGRFAIGFLP